VATTYVIGVAHSMDRESTSTNGSLPIYNTRPTDAGLTQIAWALAGCQIRRRSRRLISIARGAVDPPCDIARSDNKLTAQKSCFS
jgi:hypothetical protein